MASTGSTWRTHPFKSGALYEAKRSFDALSGGFQQGRRYRLRHIGYSHYDSCTVFTFEDELTSQQLAWWWSDEDPESSCHERFHIGR